MGDYDDDYSEEYEKERMERDVHDIKNSADDQMREYYNQNPAAKSKVNRIILITLGLIALIIFALAMLA